MPSTATKRQPPLTRCPEDEVLVCVARSRMDSAAAERLYDVLQGELDWKRLLRSARRNGLTQLLYRHLADTCPEALPEETLAELQKRYHETAVRNLFMTGELIRLNSLFDSLGVPILAYKGPVLAATLYGKLAHREFGDLDLLLRGDDMPAARDLLMAEGYQPFCHLVQRHESFHLKKNNEYRFTRADTGVAVDVHWHIAPSYFHFPLKTESLMERSVSVEMGGAQVPTLSDEDLLLVLCHHGVFHIWERLEWIAGVAEVLRAPRELDWDLVLARAQELRCERALRIGLWLAAGLLDAPLPEEISARVEADPAARLLAQEALARLFQEEPAPPGLMEKIRYHTLSAERPADRASYVLRLAVTPNQGDWAAIPLPSSLFFLYYILRPFRLAGEILPEALRRLRAGGGAAKGPV